MASGRIVLRCAASTAGETASYDPFGCKRDAEKRPSQLGRRGRRNAG